MPADLDPATTAAPGQFLDSPLSRITRQPLILGLFLPVQSGGWSASLLPRTTDWRFGYNAALTRRAEELGFDLVFGLAQWTSKGGYGGISKYREDSLDPFIAVTALSAITERILLISTIHVLFGPQGNRISKLSQYPGQKAIAPCGPPELFLQRAFGSFLYGSG